MWSNVPISGNNKKKKISCRFGALSYHLYQILSSLPQCNYPIATMGISLSVFFIFWFLCTSIFPLLSGNNFWVYLGHRSEVLKAVVDFILKVGWLCLGLLFSLKLKAWYQNYNALPVLCAVKKGMVSLSRASISKEEH